MRISNWIDAKMGRILEDAAKEANVDVKKLIELIESYFSFIRICMASYKFPIILIKHLGKFRPYYYKLEKRKKELEVMKINGGVLYKDSEYELKEITEALNRIERETNRKKRNSKFKKIE